jgi:hypothetical protein
MHISAVLGLILIHALLSSYASCIIPLNSTKNERKQNYRWVQKSVALYTGRFNHLSTSLDLTTRPSYQRLQSESNHT